MREIFLFLNFCCLFRDKFIINVIKFYILYRSKCLTKLRPFTIIDIVHMEDSNLNNSEPEQLMTLIEIKSLTNLESIRYLSA